MQRIYSDVIQFRGNHYELGKKQGEQLKDSYILDNRKKQWKIRRPRFAIDVREAKAVFSSFAPQMWDEFLGLQDALQWPMQQVLKEFGGYRLDTHPSGCSVLTYENYFVRNYDYHPKTYEGRLVFFQPDRGYATIGPSQRITGRSDGMNEKGLVVAYNFMHRKNPGDGFVCNMICRIVLESCATVTEAIDMLQRIPHRHSFSYIVMDPFAESFVVEATPRGVEVRKAHVCTNHFEKLTDENRNYLKDSYERLQVMRDHIHDGVDAKEAFRLLNDSDQGVFSKQYKNWAGTIHTAVYFSHSKNVWFALGGDSEPATIDFAAWLRGKDLSLTRIFGKVDTQLPFVHMEENVR
ncbi:MAG TPA: C45 family peptidase [Bacillota bacterium]|nr:C45 family peptidase [Bacillota bacterium]